MSTVTQLPTETTVHTGSVDFVPNEEEKDTSAKKEEGRDYVVLKREEQKSPNSPLQWSFVANISATSAEQAVRRAAETPGLSFLNPSGSTTLVAVPARSFNPVTLTVRTETTIVLS